jgi:ubiquinone/menaquinone biosynthesis C-methylase UbiE
MSGLDASATLIEHAREGRGHEQLVCADATAMPWPDGYFDLAIAFMSLQEGWLDEVLVRRALAPVQRMDTSGTQHAWTWPWWHRVIA